MPTYTVNIYNNDPLFILSRTIGGTDTWTGEATPSGTATITDNEPGVQGQTIDSDAAGGESATADVTVGGSTSTGAPIYAEESWTLRDTVTGDTFEVITFRVDSGGATGYYTLSELPLVVGRSYETLDYDTNPNVLAGDPAFSIDDYVEVGAEVDGTSGDDTIDAAYTDVDGDSLGSGDDTVLAGDGNDSVEGSAGDDFVYGQAGNDDLSGGDGADVIEGGSGGDTISGGSGDDTIHGDVSPEADQWEYEVYDYDFTSSDGQAFDIENGTLAGSGQTDTFDSTTLVNDARGTSGNPSDFGVIYTSQLLVDEDGTYTFSTTSDDGSTIRIFDENGTALTWTNQGGSTASFMDNDQHQAPTTRSGEVTLEAGRLYTIEVRHWENQGGQVISGQVTSPSGTTEDLADSDLVIGPASGVAGDDSIDAGDGDDRVFAGAGNDTIDGGTGADTIYGGLGDDEMYLAEGDEAFGGDGDDLFVLGDLGEAGSSTITITGGEGDETAGDTLQLTSDLTQDDITFTNTDDAAGGLSGTFTMADGTVVNFSEIENIICFTPGARILTEHGERPIETLRPGDRVLTHDNGLQPIRWIGHSTVEGRGRFAPIAVNSKVMQGARRPLLVSPQHRLLFRGYRAELLFGQSEVLVAAKHLVDGVDVRIAERPKVTYFHLMLDRHEVIYAEGAATESFHAGDHAVSALSPRARFEMFQTFPHLRADLSVYGTTARPCLKAYEARALSPVAA